MKAPVYALVALSFAVAACGELIPVPQPTQIPPTTTLEPPTAPAEVASSTPTSPPATEAPPASAPATETPVGQLFRDDFSGRLGPGWTWENEDPSRWTITPDGWLQIIGGDQSLLHDGTQTNLLWRDLPSGNFQVTIHVKANPTDDFQQATLYLYEDPSNYMAINRGFCSPCGTGGNGVYMEYKIGGGSGSYNAAVTATDLYLRLMSQDGVLSGYYAIAPDGWVRLGRFGDYFAFKRVGLGVSNVDRQEINADLVGQFDWFEIDRP
jgi:hypothetical protein